MRSLAQPGGNVTGMSLAMPELDRKRLEVLKETVPSISAVAFLFSTGTIETELTGLDEAARRLGIRLQRVPMSEPGELDAAFVAIAKSGSHAVLVQDAPLFARQVDRVAVLALKYRLPAISQMPRFDETGGLLWYGADVFDMFRRSATQVDKILKGAKPGDIPVEQPTKVESEDREDPRHHDPTNAPVAGGSADRVTRPRPTRPTLESPPPIVQVCA